MAEDNDDDDGDDYDDGCFIQRQVIKLSALTSECMERICIKLACNVFAFRDFRGQNISCE